MKNRLLLAVAASVAAIDTLTKAIAVASFRRTPFRLPHGWWLQVVHNNGVIGGFGAGTVAPDVFAVVAAVEIIYLAIVTRNRPGGLRAVALGLLLGGYAGNAGESRLTGHVVDWIHPPHIPIAFDLADVAVVCGQMLIIALLLSGHRATLREAAA